jgi:hypothetical protein
MICTGLPSTLLTSRPSLTLMPTPDCASHAAWAASNSNMLQGTNLFIHWFMHWRRRPGL